MGVSETKGRVGQPAVQQKQAEAKPAAQAASAAAAPVAAERPAGWSATAAIREATRVMEQPINITFIANTDDKLMATERTLTPWALAPKPSKVPYRHQEFVNDVLGFAKGRPIASLRISGHGSTGSQRISEKVALRVSMTDDEKAELAKLKPHFAKGAEVTLEGCSVGATKSGEALLSLLSQLWGVKVRGAIIPQFPLPGLEGSSNVAVPDPNGGQPTILRERSAFNSVLRRELDAGTLDLMWRSMHDTRQDPDGLKGLSTPGRHYYLTKVLSHVKTDDQADSVVAYFRGAEPEQRRELYAALEARSWQGDFHRSPLPLQTDDLARFLPAKHAEELKRLLNEP